MRTSPKTTDAVDMRVRLGGLELRSPVLSASGTFASGREYADFIDLERLGALVTKGVSLEPWAGNDAPRIAETPSGMLNSIGLQNPGVDAFIERDLAWLANVNVPVVVNVSGHSCRRVRPRDRATRRRGARRRVRGEYLVPECRCRRYGVRHRLPVGREGHEWSAGARRPNRSS